MNGLTYTDIFCGAGGSSIGLREAGYELRLAANHWDRAIETHSANFPDAEHLIADVSNYDMRRLPKTDLLWISPECTWNSPAGGRPRRSAQKMLFGEPLPTEAEIRSRATALDVIRATEVHRYPAVIVENVVEFAAWEMFDWWLAGMSKMGYAHQVVCVSAAHVGGATNPYAPQWRDRLYIVFTANGVPLPDVEPRPLAHCDRCDQLVHARQAWKRPGNRIGKYGQQYVYVCPACSDAVEPYVLPAAAAIDWTDLGQRIGDRAKPLAPATMRRIQAGIDMFAQPTVVACPPFAVNVNHGGDDGRPYPVDERPLPPRTTKIGDGLTCPPFMVERRDYNGPDAHQVQPITNPLTPVTAGGRTVQTVVMPEPFVTMLRANNRPTGVGDEPLATLSTGRNHALTVPPGAFISKHHGGLDYGPIEHMNKSVNEPMPGVVVKPNLSLVIPYRRGARPYAADDRPLSTVSTIESEALLRGSIDVDDCHFRMLGPREHLRAQRFPDTYVVHGNKGEQTMQAGNAVASNVAHWLAQQVAIALDAA